MRRCDRRPIVYGPVCVHLDRQHKIATHTSIIESALAPVSAWSISSVLHMNPAPVQPQTVPNCPVKARDDVQVRSAPWARRRHKKRLFSSSRPSKRLSWTVLSGSIISHTPLINPAPRVRVDNSLVVARTRRCGRRRIVSEPVCACSGAQKCNPYVQNRTGTGARERIQHLVRIIHESCTTPAARGPASLLATTKS